MNAFDYGVIGSYGVFLFLACVEGFRAGSRGFAVLDFVSGCLVISGGAWASREPRGGLLLLMLAGAMALVLWLARFMNIKRILPEGLMVFLSTVFFGYGVWRFIS